ncbi:Fusaric acid resistance protein family protein [Modicisalibacter ilicicola DSM 19980]|uniref:Fusaric acid resistance protein family protein n=1 Tax=Modicisalibacter ilicicola DSM 19980 TaxID=1121942 RepID=A0A1M4ZDV9_9GAMM|nr:FUSC family protein [Halomonas ilicicola]SHF16191.1 Fusaric acid resistance protein family protein [Halomonas ilicicola DSM 19980]
MSPLRLRDPYFNYRYRHYLHVLRTSLALAATFLIVSLVQIPHSSWALVSTLVVVGNLPHIGSVLDKGGQRLLGTILGATWGIVLMLIPDPPVGVVPIWTLISIAIATYATFATRYGYSALIFGISVLLVVGSGDHDLAIALWRAFNVLLGTLVGILVTVLVLPQKATDVLRFLLADNLDKLARLYHAHTSAPAESDVDTRDLLKTTTAQLVEQRKLVDAIHSERRLGRKELDSLLSLQRRMLSTIELLLETHWTTRAGHDRIDAMQGLRESQHRLARVLGTLAFQVRTGQPIEVEVERFDLEQYATQATSARGEDGRMLFSPSGYLWLNRELARLTRELSLRLGRLRRLPSKRLRRRASHHTLVSDARRLAVGPGARNSDKGVPRDDSQRP